MVKVVYKTIMTCDFCGKQFDPGDCYPQSPSGEYAVFNLSLSFYIPSGIPGPSKVFGEDSPDMGRASGHMCGECMESISRKIGYNKRSSKEVTDG